jgi:hypothetical protein
MTSILKSEGCKPLAVSVKKGCALIDNGPTRLYELINSGEIESYRDGKSRKVVVASLEAYVARQIAAEATKPSPEWTHRATQARAAKQKIGS